MLPRRPAASRWLLALATLLLLGACGCALPGSPARPLKRIELVFSPKQWETYRERLATNSREDFEVSVGTSTAAELVRATAHLRGQNTFRCRRRNYTVNLFGQRSSAILEGSPSDEVYLLSLCRDPGYIHQHTVLALWSELGLFPNTFEYVEVRLNGVSQGLYLLVEKLERLRFSRLEVDGLFRRGFAAGRTTWELKYARQDAVAEVDALEAAFEGLDALSGEELVAAFEERMDLDQYLVWLATNTLLENGDSVDELWILAERRSNGGRFYRFAGWDPEDVFRPCHYEGRFAFEDPHGLVYCAEAEWDELLLADPVGYARYVDVLQNLIENRLTEDRFERALAATESELGRYLGRPEIAEAMREGREALPLAREAIAAARRSFRRRRGELIARLERYRGLSSLPPVVDDLASH